MENDFNIHEWQAKYLKEETIKYRGYNGEIQIDGNTEGIDQNFKDELAYALSIVKGNIEKGLKYHTDQNKVIRNLSLTINHKGDTNCQIEFE